MAAKKISKPKSTEADKDRDFLADYLDQVWRFPKGIGREFRALALCDRGMLQREMRVYSVRAGGERIEYRTAYRITKDGLAMLAPTASPADASS